MAGGSKLVSTLAPPPKAHTHLRRESAAKVIHQNQRARKRRLKMVIFFSSFVYSTNSLFVLCYYLCLFIILLITPNAFCDGMMILQLNCANICIHYLIYLSCFSEIDIIFNKISIQKNEFRNKPKNKKFKPKDITKKLNKK